ncbi:hypothetical protein GCM10009734_56980 [Nonomuraea bangladeshensis]
MPFAVDSNPGNQLSMHAYCFRQVFQNAVQRGPLPFGFRLCDGLASF